MTQKPGYEIPGEMREFAERSVEQAKKAFDGFMTAAKKATDDVNDTAEQARKGTLDMSVKAMTYAEGNVAAAFELAQKMVRARDVSEMMSLQANYLKSQMEAFQGQMKEVGEQVQKAAAKVTKPGK
jgi:phasin